MMYDECIVGLWRIVIIQLVETEQSQHSIMHNTVLSFISILIFSYILSLGFSLGEWIWRSFLF
jgi:hypothetical protein